MWASKNAQHLVGQRGPSDEGPPAARVVVFDAYPPRTILRRAACLQPRRRVALETNEDGPVVRRGVHHDAVRVREGRREGHGEGEL